MANNIDIEEAQRALLEELSRYVSFSAQEWEDIRSRWTIKAFRKKQILLAEGQVEQYFYFIIEGVHRLYYVDRKGEDQTLAFGYHRNFSGNLYSLITQTPSDYFLDALTDGEMLALPLQDLNALFDKYPVMDRWGRLFYQDILVGRGKREREMMTMTAEERFQRLLRESPHIFQLVPHKYLASYIGMRPETFSRMWKKG